MRDSGGAALGCVACVIWWCVIWCVCGRYDMVGVVCVIWWVWLV